MERKVLGAKRGDPEISNHQLYRLVIGLGHLCSHSLRGLVFCVHSVVDLQKTEVILIIILDRCVSVPPSPPQLINFDDLIPGMEGREFTIGCAAEKGKPPATISWVISDTPDGGSAVRILGRIPLEKEKEEESEKKKKKKKKGMEDEELVSTETPPIRDTVKDEVKKEDELFTVRSSLK